MLSADTAIVLGRMEAQMLIRQFPPELKKTLVDEAHPWAANDLAVALLAERFKVRYVRAYERSSGIGRHDQLWLRMPVQLRTKINVAAARSRMTQRDIVVGVLREELGAPA